MLKISLLVIAGALALGGAAGAKGVSVKGTVRTSGAYVAPHFRTAPDRTRFNNYSARPNVNPFTGTRGTKNPLSIKRR